MYLLDPHPVFLSSSSLVLYTHGLFFAVGALVATLLLVRHTRRLSYRPLEVVEKCFWIFLVGIICARLGYLLTYLNSWTSVSQIWQIWQGGLLSYTGILGGLGMAWFFARGLPTAERWKWADALLQAALVGWAIGRIGNYYAADSVGVISHTWSAFYGRVPIQLFESLWCLVLVVALRVYATGQPGQLARYGVIGYLAGRVLIDIWRDETVFVFLHVSQWASILLLLILLVNKKRLTHA